MNLDVPIFPPKCPTCEKRVWYWQKKAWTYFPYGDHNILTDIQHARCTKW